MWPYKQFGGLSKFHAHAYFYGPGCEKKMNYIIISLTQWTCCDKVTGNVKNFMLQKSCSLCQNISHCEKVHYYHMTVDTT